MDEWFRWKHEEECLDLWLFKRLFLGRSHEFIDLLFDYGDKLHKMLLFLTS